MNRILTTGRLRSVIVFALLISSLFLYGNKALGINDGGKSLAANVNQGYLSLLTPTPTPTPDADLYTYGWPDQSYVPSGGQVNFSIYVVNDGPDDASNVTLTGELPSGVTFDNAVANNGTCTGALDAASFTCTFSTVSASATEMISVSANVTGTPYTLIVTTLAVASDTFDHNTDNNSTSTAQFYIASPPLPSPTPGPTNEAQLAYLKFDENTSQDDIFRQRADAAGLTNLTDSSDAEESNFIWSPDGSKIGFLSYDYTNFGISFCAMDADGSNLTVLTNVSGEHVNSFAWSPDSSKLIFSASTSSSETSTSEVFVINADGTGRTNVSGTDGYNTDPAWSPDGTQISFTRAHYFSNSPSTSDIYVADADGTNQVQIAHAEGDLDVGAFWSPDGTQLAFTRYLADNTTSVYLVLPDGSDIRRLLADTDVQTFYPLWSPDGSKLTFSSYGPDGELFETIDADGTGRTTIYSSPQNSLSYSVGGWQWSPDGTKLAFQYVVGEGQGGNVCVVNDDGTGLLCIGSNDLEYNGNVEWSPDSARLAFTSMRNGVASIDLVNADGTGRIELTHDDAYAPKWRPAQ
jgi:TolB protein